LFLVVLLPLYSEGIILNWTNLCVKCEAGEQVEDDCKGACVELDGYCDFDIGCPLCKEGFFSPNGSKCQECEAGSYSDEEGSAKCNLCDPGQFQPERGQNKCLVCSPGTFGDTKGSTTPENCKKCPMGNFCVNGIIQICGLGKYCPQEGMMQPLLCPRGSYCNKENSSTHENCEKGYYNDEEGRIECRECPANEYCPENGMSRPHGCYFLMESRPRSTECKFGNAFYIVMGIAVIQVIVIISIVIVTKIKNEKQKQVDENAKIIPTPTGPKYTGL